jgi:hypothetical protein
VLDNFSVADGGWTSESRYPRELGDVSGDGMADIVGFGDGRVFVSLASGGGNFGPLAFKLDNFGVIGGGWTSGDTYPRRVADVTGDGLADIVGFGDGGVFVSLATGGGNFGAASFQLGNFGVIGGGWTSEDRYPRELADVNGDGLADIIGFGDSGVFVSLATGGGKFAVAAFELDNFAVHGGGWTTADKYPRQLADINGDHLADIIGLGDGGVWASLSEGHYIV